MKRDVAFVDLDQTLASNPFKDGVFPAIAEDIAGQHPEVGPSSVLAQITQVNAERLESRRPDANDWDEVVDEAVRRLGTRWDGNVVELLQEHLHIAYAFPGAREFLADLDKAGFLVVLATQGLRRYQEPLLEELSLGHLVDEELYPDERGVLKRHRSYYGPLARGRRRVVVVGDGYLDDGVYPAHFGFTSIWLTAWRRVGAVRSPVSPTHEAASFTTAAHLATGAGPAAGETGGGCKLCGGPTPDGKGCVLCSFLKRQAASPGLLEARR